MPLQFPGQWRFTPPPGSKPIPEEAVSEFRQLVGKVAAQGDRWNNLEHFKRFFMGAIGSTPSWSSSEDWADTDLRDFMRLAAQNPLLFLEALHDAFESIQGKHGFHVPDVTLINKICREHTIGFELQPPRIIQVSAGSEPIQVPPPPATLEDKAVQLLQESVQRSEQLLSEGHPREAVQEMLWVLNRLQQGSKDYHYKEGK